MRCTKIFLGVLAVASGMFLATGVANAAIVTFYDNQAAFEAATPALSLIDFEGVAPPGTYLSLPSYTDQGVQFTSTPGAYGSGVAVADRNAPTYGAPYASDIIAALFSGSDLVVTFPAGISAVGGNFGPLYPSGDLGLTLTGTTGQLSNLFFSPAPGFGFGATPGFYGWVVEGDTITGLQIHAAYPAADNVQFGVPEPASFSLLLLGVGGVLTSRRWRA